MKFCMYGRKNKVGENETDKFCQQFDGLFKDVGLVPVDENIDIIEFFNSLVFYGDGQVVEIRQPGPEDYQDGIQSEIPVLGHHVRLVIRENFETSKICSSYYFHLELPV